MDTQEWLDVVDLQDRVLAQQTRREVHERGLLHRAVSILIFDPSGRLLIQQRSRFKDQDPGLFSPSASGHVDAGEPYARAAARELEEEVGLVEDLHWLHTLPPNAERGLEFTAIYRGRSQGSPDPEPQEVQAVAWRTLNELQHDMRAHPERFTASFRLVFSWYLSHQPGWP